MSTSLMVKNLSISLILKISESDLVVSYHMLEHLSDPTVAIKKIFKSMKNKAVFHVEVPIETGTPRIRFGHMVN